MGAINTGRGQWSGVHQPSSVEKHTMSKVRQPRCVCWVLTNAALHGKCVGMLWLALGHLLGDGHQWKLGLLSFAVRVHQLQEGWNGGGDSHGEPGEVSHLQKGTQDVRPERPWHACLELPSVCHCVLQVKQALECKGNIPSCCNSRSVKILSGQNHFTDTSDRATCSLMSEAWLRQTIWRQIRLKCTLSTVHMFV